MPSCSTVPSWMIICCNFQEQAVQLLGNSLHWWCQMSGLCPIQWLVRSGDTSCSKQPVRA